MFDDLPKGVQRKLLSEAEYINGLEKSVKQGSTLDRKFGGNGRYVWEVVTKSSFQETVGAIREFWRAFKPLAFQNGENPVGLLREALGRVKGKK